MRHLFYQAAGLLLTLLLSAAPVQAQSYEKLWKQVEQAREKSLPKTVVERTDLIYRKALAEQNSPQLLKAYLCREAAQRRLTPDSLYSDIARLERWADEEKNPTDRAILHSLLARTYADYWRDNRYKLAGRTDVADEPSADIRTWTARQFVEQVEAHSLASLSDADRLTQVSTDDYLPFIKQGETSAYYGHDFYHLLTRRAIGALNSMEGAGADSLLHARADSLYRQMLDVYTRRPDRAEAVILTTLDYQQWKQGEYLNQSRYYSAEARDRETEEAYLRTLDDLTARYADHPVCAEVYYRKAQWMSYGGEGRSVAEAIRLCDEAIRRYPAYARIGQLKQLRAELLRPQVEFSGNILGYPGDTLRLNVRYRTLIAPVTLTLYATNLTEYTEQYDCNNVKEFRQCSPRRIYTASHTLTPLPEAGEQPADVPYLPSDTTVSLPLPSQPGIYIVEATSKGKNVRTSRRFLSVSALRLMTLNLGDGQLELTALDGKSGHPVPGATVSIYTSGSETSRKLLQEATTGTNGKAILTCPQEGRGYYYSVRKGTDTAMPPMHAYLYRTDHSSEEPQYNLTLLTDRTIYRPGQTVYLKGVASRIGADSAQVVTNEAFDLELLDANGKQVATRTLRTNDFGSFTADFALPTICLNGTFRIQAKGKANTSVHFKVEEYKRPTFEITFQPITVPYCAGETVTLRGQVKSFSGATVQQMPLAYRVTTRNRARFYPRKEEPVITDTVQLDEEGRFAIPLKLDKPADNGIVPLAYFPTYHIEASVTDEAGETQTATYYLSVSAEAFSIGFQMPVVLCKEDTGHWTVSAHNSERIPQALTVNWRIDRTEDAIKGIKDKTPLLSGICHTDSLQPYALWKSLPSGAYRLTASATDSLGHRVESFTQFTLFSKSDTRPPVPTVDNGFFFYKEHIEEIEPGEKASFYLGTSLQDACVWMNILTNGKRVESRLLQLSDTLMRMEVPYLDTYGETVNVLFSMVKEGRFYNLNHQLRKKKPDTRLTLKWATFRDRLQPGQDEEWRLTVTTPNGLPAAAEVLALMYDASLDKLYPNSPLWKIFFPYRAYWHRADFNYTGNFSLSPYFTVPDWTVPSLVYDRFYTPYIYGSTQQVVIRGYASTRNAALTGAVAKAAVAEDAMFASVEESGPAVNVVLEEETVTRREVQESGETLQPMDDLRTNFAETAFFYPQLRTNAQGEVVIAFTVPQSLTRWNFRGYAHTPKMQMGQLEASVVTAKEFMLRPNLPRFLRVGDQTQIAATVNNLTNEPIKGTVVMQLFDPATEKVLLTRKQKFEAAAGRNAAVSFAFEVDDRHDLLGIRLMADGGTFSDGEQHLLPVLSDQTQVTETLTFDLKGNDVCTLPLDTLFNHDSLTATHRRLTVEVTGNPAWLAIQALPALTQPTDENAISWAGAYYANTLAAFILQSQPRIKAIFDSWQVDGEETFRSRLEQNQELKNMLLSETPWLAEAVNETERMRRLAQLFDTNRQRNLLLSSLTKLKELQGEDGGWSWYKGMPSSRSITNYITTLLVRLPLLTGSPLDADAMQMKQRALHYLTEEAREEYKRLRKAEQEGNAFHSISDAALNYLYLLALDGNEVPKGEKEMYNYFLARIPRLLTNESMQRKARCTVILQAAGRQTEAAEFEASLKEHLIQEENMGAHFAFNDRYYTWGMMPVSVHVAAMEALNHFGGNETLIEEMKRWLLKQKQTTAWETPIASADAVYALLCNGRNWLTDRGEVIITLGREQINTTETSDTTRPLQGLGYAKETYAEGNAALKAKQLTAEKRDTGMAWGAVYAQYLSPISEVKAWGDELSVEKQLYVEQYDAAGRASLHLVTDGTLLRVGDKVVTRLVLHLDRAMDYVQLKDSRAACLEPLSVLSGYRWNNGFGYYAETKDASSRFYFDQLGKGTYVLEYSCRVARNGAYRSGLATVQCAYAPEMSAHSASTELRIAEQ